MWFSWSTSTVLVESRNPSDDISDLFEISLRFRDFVHARVYLTRNAATPAHGEFFRFMAEITWIYLA
jgi:uncharacterized membrane protein